MVRTNLNHSVLILSILFAVFSPSAIAAEETGTVTGTLVDEEKGWPIRGATVYLLGASEEIRTQSDFKGVFTFTAPAGTYSGLAVMRPGGEEIYEIEAPLPIEAGAEDDLAEIPVPRPQGEQLEPSPFAPPPSQPDDSSNAPPEPEVGQATPPLEAAPPETSPNLIPILPPENQPQQPPQPPPGQPEEIRAWLGIYMQDTTPQTDPAGPQSPGTVITILNVFPGSPAERAQMKEGDVLITMDGERLSNVQDLQRRLEEYRPGMKPRFLLMRNGTFLETVVTLEEITQSMMEALQPPPGQPTQPGAPGGQPPTGQPPSGQPPFGQPPTSGQAPNFPPGAAPPSGGPQQGPSGRQNGSQVPPLIEEARQLSAQGQFLQASEKYDEHLRQYPNDGRAAAEQAEMVFFNIQNARGMALMAQAVKKQGLSVPEKTRLRMVIASRRFESGNLITAKQMLIEALRDDPTNPDVNRLLDVIYQIEAAARAQQAPVGPGHPKTDLEIHLEHEFSKALEDLFD